MITSEHLVMQFTNWQWPSLNFKVLLLKIGYVSPCAFNYEFGCQPNILMRICSFNVDDYVTITPQLCNQNFRIIFWKPIVRRWIVFFANCIVGIRRWNRYCYVNDVFPACLKESDDFAGCLSRKDGENDGYSMCL